MRLFVFLVGGIAFMALGAENLVPPARANWVTALSKGAGKVARHAEGELGAIGRAAGHLHDLPEGAKGALAAHATPEGHWQFMNKEGQAFTAGTPDEFKRIVPSLMPGAANGETKVSLYLSEDSVFANRAALDKLPKDADLHLVTEYGAFPLKRSAGGELKLAVKANVTLEAAEQTIVHESLSFLSRPLNKSDIRTLSIDPEATKGLFSAPRFDPATKMPLVDAIAPERLADAFASIRGQTALLVGRVDKNAIHFQPSKGAEVSADLAELMDAAGRSDVNLIVLQAEAPRQPGGRNWLWQTIEVGGLKDAAERATFGDFLDALGARRAPLLLAGERSGSGRIHLHASQDSLSAPAAVEHTLGELIGDVTGEVLTNGADISARDQSSQRENDARLIPGIPSYVQIPYFLAVVCGLLAWGISRSWWERLWPSPPRRAGEGRLRHTLRSALNFFVYLLAFLPVAGVWAFVWMLLLNAWATATAPFRWLAKLLRRRAEV